MKAFVVAQYGKDSIRAADVRDRRSATMTSWSG